MKQIAKERAGDTKSHLHKRDTWKLVYYYGFGVRCEELLEATTKRAAVCEAKAKWTKTIRRFEEDDPLAGLGSGWVEHIRFTSYRIE